MKFVFCAGPTNSIPVMVSCRENTRNKAKNREKKPILRVCAVFGHGMSKINRADHDTHYVMSAGLSEYAGSDGYQNAIAGAMLYAGIP